MYDQNNHVNKATPGTYFNIKNTMPTDGNFRPSWTNARKQKY